MAGQRGQRSTLVIGGVKAEVALLKTSQKPRDAQYETRRVEEAAVVEASQDASIVRTADGQGMSAEEARARAATTGHDDMAIGDPLGAEPSAPEPTGGFDPLPAEPAPDEAAAAAAEPTIQRGVTGPGGVFVDLTDELEAIDERTRLEAMEVEATVARNAVPSERVRDSHYVAPAGEGAPKVLALLWRALRESNKAALVRWTKRTNQALGALVARGSATDPHLVLLELEWEANVQEVPPRARLLPAMALVSESEVVAAKDLVDAWHEPPSVFEDVRDERAAQRAELLNGARESGAAPTVAPQEKMQPTEQAERLREALAAA